MRNEAPVIVLAEWAARVNAETRTFMGVSVAPEIPERQEARAYLAGLMSPEEAAARVAADLERAREALLGGQPVDEYEGLPWSFAAACRAADEKQRRKPPVSGASVLAPRIPISTLWAAEYLVRAGNAEQLQQWLAKHSAAERTAIQKHLGRQAHARTHAANPRTDR